MAIKKTVKKEGKYILEYTPNGGRKWLKVDSYPTLEDAYEGMDEQEYFSNYASDGPWFYRGDYRIRRRNAVRKKSVVKKKTTKKNGKK